MIPTTAAILLVFLGSLWALFIHLRSQKTSRRLPPGPYPLPILGNLHMLGSLPHRSLQKLAKKYGPIMALRLGNVLTIVVSSPYYAKQILKTHDNNFANRPKVLVSEYMTYGGKGIALTEYGPYLKNVRSLCMSELLTASKITSFGSIRREEIGVMLESVKRCAAVGEDVDVSTMLARLTEDTICRMIFGKCKDDRFDLKGVIEEYMRMNGVLNISDYLPWLAPFDPQGLTRHMKATSKNIDEILDAIIFEHDEDKGEHKSRHNNFTSMLLSLTKPHKNNTSEDSFTLDRMHAKAIILDLLAAGMDTTTTTIQWIFLNLMKHPRVMKKVQAELEAVAGLSKMIQEDDLVKLVYLDMVIKESLRLYPVAPLLIPHESMEESSVNGYLIPKKTRVLVNLWSIGRDPEVWTENAEAFYPERFESNNVDYRSPDFQLLTFGYGRRGCIGMQLGLRMVQIVIAQLMHCFQWELPKGKFPQDVDMSETFGITISPANTLFAVPTYRLHV